VVFLTSDVLIKGIINKTNKETNIARIPPAKLDPIIDKKIINKYI
jgi:hypothetical protein